MNFKKTALVLAIAGVVAAPITAQASVADGAYASFRIGLKMLTTNGGEGKKNGTAADGTSTTNIGNASSRFGFKGENDLGNGMTAFGQYEFSINADGSSAAAIGMRDAFVGIKGDFGSVKLGRDDSTFYDFAFGPNDNPWWSTGVAMVSTGSSAANKLMYAGSAGDISYGATLQMGNEAKTKENKQEMIDTMELGVSYDAGFGTIGLGYLDAKADKSDGTTKDPDPVIGLALSGVQAGPTTLGFGFQTQKVAKIGTVDSRTRTSMLFEVMYNTAYIHYESLTEDKKASTGVKAGADDKTNLAIGYSKSLGPQTTAWFEYYTVATESGVAGDNTGDDTGLFAVLKYDL